MPYPPDKYALSWTSGEPRHSRFKLQIVAFPLLCVIFLVELLLVENLLHAFPTLLPDLFSPLGKISVAPVTTSVTKDFIFHIFWISI
jgi:hypothetical protein